MGYTSWYILIYALIILFSPWHLRIKEKYPTFIILIASGFLYLLAWFVRFEMGTENLVLLLFGKLGMTMFEYDLGALAAKEKVFTKIFENSKKYSSMVCGLMGILTLMGMLLGHTLIVGNIVVAPLTGFVLIVLFKSLYKPKWVCTLLSFISKYSTGIWLVHMYYYANVFEKLVYKAYYPIFIFLFLLGLSLITSMIVESVYKKGELILGKGNVK